LERAPALESHAQGLGFVYVDFGKTKSRVVAPVIAIDAKDVKFV
jgi:hypothetical protein